MITDFYSIFFSDQVKVAPDEKTTAGYATFNLKLSIVNLNIAGVRSGISIGFENIFDKEYRNHLSTNRGFILSEPGRNIFIRVNLAF